MRRAARVPVLWGLVLALAPGAPLGAQPALDEVEELIAQGRVTEARQTLEEWWSSDRSQEHSRDRQHALWLRGRLSLDGNRAELDFRRLVVEHPGGPYSDDALFRLAQAAHAEGELAQAGRQFRTLLRDYPASPLRPEAQRWLDRFGGNPPPLPEVPDAPASGTDAASSEGGGGDGAEEERLPYAVQLGAFSSEWRAQRLWERARSARLEPRLVRIPGSGLLRVRVGRFPDSPTAERLLRRVRGLGFEATIVTDRLEEEPLR